MPERSGPDRVNYRIVHGSGKTGIAKILLFGKIVAHGNRDASTLRWSRYPKKLNLAFTIFRH